MRVGQSEMLKQRAKYNGETEGILVKYRAKNDGQTGGMDDGETEGNVRTEEHSAIVKRRALL